MLSKWGCDTVLADDITQELKARMASRGDTAQLKITEKNLQRTAEINEKVDLIMRHLAPKTMEVADR